MDSSTAIDLVRQATLLALLIGAPVLTASVVVGLVVSIFQAVTQIQEQTISFVPKIVIMAVTMLLVLPWIIDRMVEYSTSLFLDIPGTF
jgi:flagellar biosynthesis protein FliQ